MKKKINILIIFTIILFLLSSPFFYSIAVTLNAYFMTNGANFNIWGDGVQTTFSDAGYNTVLKVGNTEYTVENGSGSGNSVTCKTELSYISDGGYVKITYKVTNNSNMQQSVGVSTYADIQINNDDYARITNLEGDRGFTMTDGTYTFTFLGRKTYAVTDVDAYWFGDYDLRENRKWNNRNTYEYGSGSRRGDSSMTFSWQNRSINPGETLSFSALIGIGILNTPPTIKVTSNTKPVYYPGEIFSFSGTVNDVDNGDIVSIKYSLDGGPEQIIGNNYMPNGTPITYLQNLTLTNTIQEGRHMIQIWAMDDKKNISEATTINFNVAFDRTSPSMTHKIQPETWTKDIVNIQVEASDQETGIKNIILPDQTVINGNQSSYSVQENGEYIFIAEDKAGNRAQHVVSIRNIDHQSPEVKVTPENSNWTDHVEVNLSFQDSQSGFKQYFYAITNNRGEPENWIGPIQRGQDSILIENEGTNYLHIKAEDNVGNISENKVFGSYLIDRSNPYVEIQGDLENIVIDELTLTIHPKDDFSGVKIFMINGQEINKEKVTFIKNGTYVFYVEDNVERKINQTLIINNIYHECNAGLDHPIYSSNYDECPICESIKGLIVTNDEDKIYNAKPQEVIYQNPSGGEIVVYYNGTTEKPVQVAEHHYELKVKYKGEEYKTGIEGTLKILPKEIKIEGIVGKDKIYDGTTDIQLTDGRLIGIEEGDEVGFTLPEFGTASERNVGSHYIAIDTIVLTGEKAFNYHLIQPEYGNVSATIEKRTITIKGVTAVERKYDDTNVVEIEGGELVNTIENDDVVPIVPKTGTIESTDIGIWNVIIDEIKLAGKDAKNYTLIQPEIGEITVTITKPTKPYLHLETYVQKINGKKISERPTIGVEGEESKPSQGTKPDEGKNEEIDNIEDSKIEITEKETKNEKAENKENEKVENEKVENGETDNKEIENEKTEEAETVKLKYNKQNQMPEIHYGDRLVLKYIVYNEGKGGGHAKTIQTILPEGLKFVKESQVNQKNGWKEDNGTLISDVLAYEKNRKNPISGIKQKEEGIQVAEEELTMEVNGQILSYKEIELEVEVTAEKVETTEIHAISEINQTDIRNEQIPYEEEQEKQAVESMKIRYVDLSLQQHITKIQEQNKGTGEILDHMIQPTEEMIKYEIHRKRVDNTVLKVTYQFDVTNLGNEELIEGVILNKIPEGFDFVPEDNPGWKIAKQGYLISPDLGSIKEKVTKAVTLVLSWQLKEDNMGIRKNEAVVLSRQEIDQQMVETKIRKEEEQKEDAQTENDQDRGNEVAEDNRLTEEGIKEDKAEKEGKTGKETAEEEEKTQEGIEEETEKEEIEDQKSNEEIIKIVDQLRKTNNAANSEVFIGLILGRVIKISMLGALVLAILLFGVIEIKKYVL